MATLSKTLSTNVPGDFFVDSSCIDCGTCRWMAPATFNQQGDYATVYSQPNSPEQTEKALKALICCPTSSIGTLNDHPLRSISNSFPLRIAESVYHCGFHSESTFGATSYLIKRKEGNILVDSPRFSPRLLKSIKALGKVTLLFLTHKDDVGDHRRWAKELQCERILHQGDVTSNLKDIENQPTGSDPIQLGPDLIMLPTPGHTAGSSCLLYANRFLFSGDHVAFSLKRERVIAFNTACWFNWEQQITSMESLLNVEFEYILPGHGSPCSFPKARMRAQVKACVEWMKKNPAPQRTSP